MIDHLGIQAADVDASVAFYLRVFAPLGFREVARFPVPPSSVVGIGGAHGSSTFWLSPARGEETRETHIGFVAPDRAAVDAVHAAAVEGGTEVLHAPREWPEYHAGYYATFLRDPDGHNVEVVFHGG